MKTLLATLGTLTFFLLIAGIVWASFEPEEIYTGPCRKDGCCCSAERLSAAGHARELREFAEFAFDSGL
jgi:hypothetical protein